MSTDTVAVTAEAFLHYPADGFRRELVKGEVRSMSPAGAKHGSLAMKLGSHLLQHVMGHKLGEVFAAETGFKLSSNPDTVRAPDVSFVSEPRAEQIRNHEGFIPFAPDLAIEVLSPNDRLREVQEKIADWLEAGTKAVVILDPRARIAIVHRSGVDRTVVTESESLSVKEIIPDWSLPLSELFR